MYLIYSLLFLSRTLNFNIELKDYITIQKHSDSHFFDQFKIENVSPEFNNPEHYWLVFDILTSDSIQILIYINLHYLQNLSFKNTFDIGSTDKNTFNQKLSLSHITPLQTSTKNLPNTNTPSNSPDQFQHVVNSEIIFVTKKQKLELKSINSSLTFIFKLFKIFTFSFIENRISKIQKNLADKSGTLTVIDDQNNVNYDKITNTNTNTNNSFKEDPRYQSYFKTLLKQEKNDKVEEQIYYKLYTKENYKIQFLGFTNKINCLSKNRKININYKTKNFNILIFNVNESISINDIIDNNDLSMVKITAYKFIINELVDELKENINKIFKINISKASVLYNIDNYLNIEKGNINIRNNNVNNTIKLTEKIKSKNKNKRKKKRKKRKKIIKNDQNDNISENMCNVSSNDINNNTNNNFDQSLYNEYNIGINNSIYTVYKKSEDSDNNHTKINLNENIDIKKVILLICEILKKNKGFILKFDNDNSIYILELNLNNQSLNSTDFTDFNSYNFGLNKFDFNGTVMLLYDVISLIDLILSLYFNILNFDDMNDQYNKNILRNLVVLKEEVELLINQFFEINKINEFLKKYKKYKNSKKPKNKEERKEEIKDNKINENKGLESEVIVLCQKYLKIATFGTLENDNNNNDDDEINEIDNIYKENMNKPMFIINYFIIGLLSKKISSIINKKNPKTKFDEQISLILIDLIDIETSFKINIFSSESYIFYNNNNNKSKNTYKNNENEFVFMQDLAIKRQLNRVVVDEIQKIGTEFYLGHYDKIIKYLSIKLYKNKNWQELFYKINTLIFGFMIEYTKINKFLQAYIENL